MRLCFVVPRCGEQIVGGAETLVLELARRLQRDRGHSVQMVSTCAVDNRTWENVLPLGVDTVGGLPLLRFPVDARDLERWVPLQIAVARGQTLTLEEELDWMAQSVTSAGVLEWLVSHQDDYDAFLFAPYLFGLTFWGSLAVADKAWLIPCLHDESYAYTKVVEAMFRGVGRAIFNALPERDLARSLYGAIRGDEVGMGFDAVNSAATTPSPMSGRYLVVLGRKETGKNAHLAIDYFISGKDRGLIDADVKLVIGGGGDFTDLERPHVLERGDVVDLTRLSEQDKQALLRDAVALIQPSVNESFSIVLMEAWLQGTPAIVHGRCAVTREHVVTSRGGLYFLNADDFAGAVRELCGDVALRRQLGESGATYVKEKYSWPAVLDRFERVVGVNAAQTTTALSHPSG